MKAKILPTQNSKDSCKRSFINAQKTRLYNRHWFSLLFIILLGTGLMMNSQQTYGQCNSNDPSVPFGIVPTITPQGNPPLCSGGVRLNSPTSGTYALGGGTVTITVSNTSCGQVFSWSASPGVEIHEIIAKGGPVANLYDYKIKNPRPTSDGNLHAPVGPSGGYYGLSHIDFCFTYTPPKPVCQIKIDHKITCPGGKDGAASVSASGGKAPYSFVWKDESNNSVGSGTSVSGLIAGTYTVTVTDADGRTSVCEVELEDGTAIIECYVVVEEQPEFGVSYGVATVYVTINGVPSDLDFEYEWFPSGETTKTSSMVTNSGGSVTVKHANGCETSCEIPIETGCNDLEVALDCQTEELNLDEETVIAYAQALYDKMLEDGELEVEVTVLGAEVFIGRSETGGCMWEEIWVISVEDDLGNVGNCNIKFTWKEDLEAPVIVDIPDYQLAECNAPWPTLLSTTWTDNCGVNRETSGSVSSDAGVNVIVDACIQTRLYTFKVTDDCGNVATQTVTVSRKYDMTAPVLQGELTNLVFACDADVVLPNPQFTDNCDGKITVTYAINGTEVTAVELAAHVFAEGDTKVCYTAVDACGNTTVKCIIVTVEPCVYECETAYAKGNASTCFLPTFSRWGWTNAITPGSYVFDLWAAAGQCDTGKGTWVGTVNVVYGLNGHVSVTYNVIPPFKIEETHTYVGTTMYPQVKRGRTTTSTVAPGSYYYAGPFKGGQVYVIAHAVVCGPFTTTNASSVTQKSAVIERLDNATELKVYPNPFNTRVAFEFVSGKNVNARLEIYNNVGQMITTLMDRPVEKGVLNRVEFTPSNITHGVLFYRLLLDDEVQNGKLLYTK